MKESFEKDKNDEKKIVVMTTREQVGRGCDIIADRQKGALHPSSSAHAHTHGILMRVFAHSNLGVSQGRADGGTLCEVQPT